MPRLTISHKLFAAFFLILAVVVGAMFFSRYLFSVNFHRYINQLDTERLQTLLPLLQHEYDQSGNWDQVKADSKQWQKRLDATADIRHDPQPPLDAKGNGTTSTSRILLSDSQAQPILGTSAPDDQPRLVPIEKNGQTVGWLGLKKRRPFRSGPPAALLERQGRQLTMLGVAVLAVTALLAFLFSRHLITQIRSLTTGTRELSERNFAVRIKTTSHDELGLLAENFNQMADTLERYETMRRQWLSDISHELRTPLAVLRGEIESILDGIREPSPDRLASLHGEVLRLSKLVDDLHHLSLAESGALVINKRWLYPVRIMHTALDSYKNLLDQAGITVHANLTDLEDIGCKGDADRLGQVFANILDNTVKYAQPTGSLTISAHFDGDMLELRFADSGPGVPPESLPRLFDRLYRVESSRNRGSGGSGLGLSICRQIIERHGGLIAAEVNTSGGLTIVITLPVTSKHDVERRQS